VSPNLQGRPRTDEPEGYIYPVGIRSRLNQASSRRKLSNVNIYHRNELEVKLDHADTEDVEEECKIEFASGGCGEVAGAASAE
jgi:hypothetical protein